MASNRKRLAIWAPEDRWKLLGELLHERRRIGLGHQFRTTFARARLPLTPDGNPNTRRVDDLESNRRANRWPPGTLKEMAAAYQVSYKSMLAVLAGEADVLAPVAAPEDPPAPPGELPEGIEARTPAAQDYADQIWERLLRLSDSGITAPSGAQLFPDSPADARTWDDPRLQRNWTVRARVRMIADLQYLDARPSRGEQDNAG